MRMMMRYKIPVEAGNHMSRSGLGKLMLDSLVKELKPEAVYLWPEGQKRCGIFIFDMVHNKQTAEIAEELFEQHIEVEFTPVMTAADCLEGLQEIEPKSRGKKD